MAHFIATKARILVTVATAGAMFAGVAGLQAQAQGATVLAEAAESALTVSPSTAAAPTPTATIAKKKKKKPTTPTVVVSAPVAPVKAAPVPQKKPAQNSHGSSSGSK